MLILQHHKLETLKGQRGTFHKTDGGKVAGTIKNILTFKTTTFILMENGQEILQKNVVSFTPQK